MIRFAELLGRSCFSFLEGASQPRELCQRSADLGQQAIALCDRDGLYGSARMHAAGKQLGHRCIVGSELTLTRPNPRPYAERRSPSVALLVQRHHGYTGLCRLLTRAHADCEKGEAAIGVQDIAEQATDLLAIVPLDPSAPLEDDELRLLADSFGDRCAIAVWRHLDAGDAARLRCAEQAAAHHGLPLVATARPLMHHSDRKPLSDVLCCIRQGLTLAAAGRRLAPNAEACLKSPAAMARRFAEHPEWVERSAELADRCRFSLSELRYRFPSDNGSALGPDEHLRALVTRGMADRYPAGVPLKVRAQLEKELGLVAELEVAPYFCSVKQIVDIARQRGILCQGRGSAANSAICYVLGITAVDPARSSLLFERFMSSARSEPPDIDVDFEHERREEVIQEIYRRYGRDRAAMVSEVIRFREKSALREVGKVFALSTDQLDRLSSVASHWSSTDPISPAALAKRGLDPRSPALEQVLALSAELEGFPRHLSIHVGGFVLSADPLERVAPIEPARMEGRTVIGWDKDDIDDLGFFKVDVLGLGMLTAVRKALGLVHRQQHGDDVGFDPIAALARIPPEDPVVYEAICHADTVGVFQIESRAQMAMLPILAPRAFYDLVVEVGIVRPGPIQGKMVHPYLRRRSGQEPVSFPHASLEPILARTLGVPLFQEQVMQIAIDGAGYDGGEADQLRRDMAAWRKNGRLARHRNKLLDGFARRGIAPEFGERLYQQIQGFGEYGFPESHAASFALIVYASAWLKVHHPAAFACALLNSQPMGFYSPASIVRDAQQHDVEVRPVRIERSAWNCTLEPIDGQPPPALAPQSKTPTRTQPALRLGLRMVRSLAHGSIERLLEARACRPFESLDDLVLRAGLRRDELDKLAEAGALEGLERARREALWRISAPREGELLAEQTIEPLAPAGLPPLEPVAQLALDYGTVGLSLTDHPIRHLRPGLARRRVRKADTQSGWRKGQQVTVAGVVLTRQRPMTANGVVFVTLEDETGTINLVLYPRVFERYELVARHATMMLARGRVDRRGEVVHLRVQHLERLDLPAGQSLPVRTRDFH